MAGTLPVSETGIESGGISLKRARDLILSKRNGDLEVHATDLPVGRGVFAGRDLPARTVVEVSPVLVLDPVENEEHIRKTDLYNYTYNWPLLGTESIPNGSSKNPITTQAIILGLGSMFNHSTLHQNIGWKRDIERLIVTYVTLRDIKAGEELCISYGARLTFKDTDAPEPDSDSGEDWTGRIGAIDFID